MDYGQTVLDFMKQYHLTQEELAEKMNISSRTLRWWFSGTTPHPVMWEKFLSIKAKYERRG